MKRFTKTNIANIPQEEAHGGSGKRQVLITPEHLTTPHFEMMTKAYLSPGFSFDWHDHKDVDEMFIVLSGQGNFYWQDEITGYKAGDIVTIPANTTHKITAEGDMDSEFYFVRVKA
jgi:quercetin dioxygenase-like cupin family protein